ncbi:MAG: ABC transporter permease [Acidobacteria bacterium]|nr:ABC transporter permease [Acidobacteriota bacterium]MBI3264154.1 ABC transporter permease [Acidobacteriota bacterium]
MRSIGAALLAAIAIAALAGPVLAPYDRSQQFRDQLFAPPMRIRFFDEAGQPRAPFVYRWRLVDRLERRYEEDRAQPLTLEWFSGGRLLQAPGGVPLLLFGADSFGRDQLTRWLWGARTSLAVALLATAGALLVGTVIGGIAGLASEALPSFDEGLMRITELVLVLPAIYVMLALRAALPLVLPPTAIFLLLVVILTLVGWPHIARGVRAIVIVEVREEYAIAAHALGATRTRVLFRHLLPAAGGFLRGQAVIVLPAFIVAEATLSYVGFGFPDTVPSWGTMLQEASNITTLAQFPWLLSPAVGIFLVVFGANLLLETRETR